MKILFVCRANVGRSQMAAAIYNHLTNSKDAVSAGIEPGKWEGKKLSETIYIAKCMDEISIDVKEAISKKLTNKMADEAEKVIFMAKKETLPSHLEKSSKVIFWDVEDPDGGLEVHKKCRDQIKNLVMKLIKETEKQNN